MNKCNSSRKIEDIFLILNEKWLWQCDLLPELLFYKNQESSTVSSRRPVSDQVFPIRYEV